MTARASAGGTPPRRGTLRIHFTADDLARVRVANGPDPMWESVLSMHLLQTQRGARVFSGWRKESRSRLGASALPLLALNPAAGAFPDFLTPAGGTTDLEAGVDAMLSAPRGRVRAELEALCSVPSMRPWISAVAGTELDAMKELGRLFRSYFATAISPIWGTVVAQVEAERRRMAQAFLAAGPGEVLTSVSTDSTWNPPVLEIGYPVDRDLHLDGRGILIIPSYFCWRDVVTLIDPALPPVLVYPLRTPFTASGRPVRHCGDDRELSALLGFTRATVLRALETPCTTSELGRRAGASVTSASQHAAVLRRSGLITTVRHGGAVIHSLTALGAALLRASGA
jgi:DNA-binding transcriptional ArsR family regulator